MVNKELVDYVNSATKAGHSAEEIKSELLKIGWREEAVNEAISSVMKSPASKQAAEKTEPEKSDVKRKKSHKKIYVFGLIVILAVIGITISYVLTIMPMLIPTGSCGNNVCNIGETYDSCPKDCPNPQTSGPHKISVSPAAQTVSKGNEVAVEIRISGASDVFGFQFNLEYDPNILQYKEISEGAFLSKNKADATYCVPLKIESGFLKNVACTRLGAIGGVSGDGILETVKFTAVNAGTSYMRLTNVKFADPAAQKMNFTSEDGQINVS